MAKSIHIYKIWFPTSKKCYVGQTMYLERRMLTHLNAKSLVGNALRKYDDWQVSILHTCKTRDEANRIEIEEIRNYNSVAPNGYNLTRGGDGSSGYEHSEELKMKMSESAKGNQNRRDCKLSVEIWRKISEFSKGHKLSTETRKKMSESHKGTQRVKGYKLSNEIKLNMRIGQLKRRIREAE